MILHTVCSMYNELLRAPDELKFMYKQKTQIFERETHLSHNQHLLILMEKFKKFSQEKKKVAFGKILQEQSPCVLQVPEGKFSYTLTGSDFTDKEVSDKILQYSPGEKRSSVTD